MTVTEKIRMNFETAEIKGKSFFITGATGLIGSVITDYLVSEGAHVIALARNPRKASSFSFYDKVEWIYQSIEDEIQCESEIDYLIHTASPTDSKYFITNPVETISQTISGLTNVIQLARRKNVKSFVFTSSMEVYGLCLDDRFLKENEYYSIDCTNVRNSYAEGKKILECLLVSYCTEYNVPGKIVRLCQTFGPGVSKDDNRVFAQFARSIISHNDIILSTKGETRRSYCSLTDCVTGVLTVLFHGNNGEAYNVASDDSYYSIYEMASMFAEGTESKIIINEKKDNKYLPTIKFGLDTSKVKTIGFHSVDSLRTMICEFLSYYRDLYKMDK